MWKRNVVLEKMRCYFEKSRKIYGEGDVHKVGGQEEYSGADEDIGIEGSSG